MLLVTKNLFGAYAFDGRNLLQRLDVEVLLVAEDDVSVWLVRHVFLFKLHDILQRDVRQCLVDGAVDIVVDATKDLLLNVLKYHPFLIKPNNFELGEMFGVTLHSDEEIEEYAKRLQTLGARNVAISMAGDGSMLLTETGETYRMGVPKGKVVNSVGAGDSMVAGFIASYFAEHDYKKALKYGAATGSATAFSEGLATKDQVEKLLGQF